MATADRCVNKGVGKSLPDGDSGLSASVSVNYSQIICLKCFCWQERSEKLF